jgi:hypothetical protein
MTAPGSFGSGEVECGHAGDEGAGFFWTVEAVGHG